MCYNLIDRNPSVRIRGQLPYEGEPKLLSLPFVGEVATACRLPEGFSPNSPTEVINL